MTGPIKAGARRVALALLVAAAAVAAALPWLRPPAPRTAPAAASASSGLATEPMAAVTAADAPLLAEGPVALLQPGELVLVRDRLPAMRWRGTIAGRPASREGGRLQVQRAPGEAVLVMFEAALGPVREVPSSRSVCERVAAAGERCPSSLRRLLTADGALGAYQPCWSGACPVALVRAGRVTSLAVDGLVDARPMTLGDRTVLLCTSRWVRADGNLTGGELVAVALGSEGPSRGGVVPLDRVDARGGGQVSSRTGSVEVSGEVVRFAGAERLVDRATGAEIESRPVAERYRIAADGRVTVEPAAPKDK